MVRYLAVLVFRDIAISTRPNRLFSNRTGPDQNKKSGLPDRTGPDFFHKFEKNRITTRSYKFQFQVHVSSGQFIITGIREPNAMHKLNEDVRQNYFHINLQFPWWLQVDMVTLIQIALYFFCRPPLLGMQHCCMPSNGGLQKSIKQSESKLPYQLVSTMATSMQNVCAMACCTQTLACKSLISVSS